MNTQQNTTANTNEAVISFRTHHQPLTQEAIAEIFGVTKASVFVLEKQAMKKLRRRLKEQGLSLDSFL
jgi:DNA-directed RNA polymerase sigma subunit (sigma70/sigma32)